MTVHWSTVAIPQEAGGMASLIVNMQTIGAVGAAGQAVQDVSYDGDELQRVQCRSVRWILVLVALSCTHLVARLTAFD